MTLMRNVILRQRRLYHKQIKNRTRQFSSSSSFDLIENPNDHYDVVIVGGGVVGSALANLLTSIPSTSKLSIGIINPQVPLPLSSYEHSLCNEVDSKSTQGGKPNHLLPNARSYALSPASLTMLGEESVQKLKNMNRVAPYNRMQIWESNGPATIHFSHKDLPVESKTDILGAVIEDGPLVSSLWDTIQSRQLNTLSSSLPFPNDVHFLCPGMLQQIHSNDSVSKTSDSTQNKSSNAPLTITYENTATKKSHTISTNLLVGADGGNSSVRNIIGIPSFQSPYGRRAVTCTVKMSDTLNQTAFQRFFPTGPIALLPIWSNEVKHEDTESIYANIVWSTTPEHAEHLKNLSTAEFVKELNSSLQVGPTQAPPLFPSFLTSHLPPPLANAAHGADQLFQSMNNGLTMSQWAEDPTHSYFLIPPQITDIVGTRLSFDLKLTQAKQYVSGSESSPSRVVLVGDAAHTFHPMAGQGLNLGLGDVSILSREIQKAVESGMDVGSPQSLFLKRYESERQLASSVVMGGIQFLHLAFGLDVGLGVNMRSMGMNLIGANGLIRKKLAEVAVFGGGVL